MSVDELGGPVIGLVDVLTARDRIRSHLPVTPLVNYPRLDALVGATVWVKHENHHSVGSFKCRGALNAVLAADYPVVGLVAASAGNHGQGVAKAAALVAVPACIVVPDGANEPKVAAMRSLGAEIIVGGRSAAVCNALARRLATDRGWQLVDDFCDPLVMAGAGTVAVEVLDQRPDIDAFIVPLGGGALAAGCTAAIKGLAQHVTTIGVGAAGAPATYESWRARQIVEASCATIADGLAVDRPEPAPIATLVRCLDRGMLVSEEQLGDAVVLAIDVLHNLLEPSGAASLACLLSATEDFAGQEVAIVATGANIALPVLKALLDR